MAVIKFEVKPALQIQPILCYSLKISHASYFPAISFLSATRFGSKSNEDGPYGLSAVVLNFDHLLGYE
jgi:hypothetical protein